MKEFKIKDSSELFELVKGCDVNDMETFRGLFDYVSDLENKLSTYQMMMDQITYQINSSNFNVHR